MKALICAFNTKYVHSALAPWCLKAGVREYAKDCDCKIFESTINEDFDIILGKILKYDFDLVAFSTYIWNKNLVLKLVKRIKELRNIKVALGGPEVSYNIENMFLEAPYVDYILSGEGEEPFGRLCSGENVESIPGISYIKDGEIIKKTPYVSRFDPPSPYSDEYFKRLDNRIVYLETSRGCPFRCSFCLSGRCETVRFFNIERAKENIIRLANSGAKTVKLVDRTFNADRKRARNIFFFIMDNYGKNIPTDVCFHFEIEGTLLENEDIELLKNAPKGLFQFEIGLQSFNEDTLRSINRHIALDKLCKNVKKVIALENIHVHIDLIAGLPYEDKKSFEESFNKALTLKPQMLQFGFLKMLHGSDMREKWQDVYDFDINPPYEVISNPYISKEELSLMHKVEDTFERVYNSKRFTSLCEYLHTVYESPYRMYEDLSLYLDSCEKNKTLDELTLNIYTYFQKSPYVCREKLRDLLAYDRLTTNRMGTLPEFLKVKTPKIKEMLNLLDENADTKRRSGVKRAATVLLTTNEFVYVDYMDMDPVKKVYPARKIKLENIF